MISTKPLLLTGTALLALTIAAPRAQATPASGPMVLAQASPPHEGESEKKGEHKPPQKGAKPQQHPPQPQQHQPPKPPQAQQKPPEHKPPEKPAAAPPPHEAPKAAQQPPQHQAQPNAPEHRPEKPATAVPPHQPPKATQQGPQPQHQAEPRREERRQENARPAQPGPAGQPAPANRPATIEHKPPQAPAAQTPAPQKPAAQTAPAQQPRPPAGNAQTNAPNRNAQTAAPPAAMAPPQKPQSAQQFILQKNAKPTATIQDLRKERHETREGNRTVITEGDRTIVKQDNRTIIRHDEAQRFAVGARDVNVQRQGNQTTTVVVRPDGDQIINITDERGHLVRRVRRDRSGHEFVLIDEHFAGPQRDVFVDLPPPVIHIPRDRYIVDVDQAQPDVIYDVLEAPPVEAIEQDYTVDQVRYSAPLRERMPRLDLDINFDTGSWQLTPDQIEKLSAVAEGLNRAISRNPREVFLIEGHTDAVGSPEDNLSLSDRRAEAVAVALTEQFNVPPENLVTQGYGEQDLKVQTGGASRANRRVSVRRITPLIDRQAAR